MRTPAPFSEHTPARALVGPVVLLVVLLASSMALSVSLRAPASFASGDPNVGPLDPETATHVGAGANAAGDDPANCSQTGPSLYLSATSADPTQAIVQAFDSLGTEGGGTLYLGPGVFTVNSTLDFAKYSDVSIQGAGEDQTTISLPTDPIGNFTAANGTLVGLYNETLGGPVNGTTANVIETSGPTPLNNFEMCDLTVGAEATSAAEDWTGSLIFDASGGEHHVYSDVALTGLFGPGPEPNGLHLDSSSGGAPATDYLLDNFTATNDSVPFETYPGFRGGTNFLNVGHLQNCTLENVTGIGQAAFEVQPAQACLIENWTVQGHLTIDPTVGGSWGGTVFEHVLINATGTPSSYVVSTDVSGASSGNQNLFSSLTWTDDTFVGSVNYAANMVSVEDSTFSGCVNELPSVFLGNSMDCSHTTVEPIEVDGTPTGGNTSVIAGNTFVFPNGTGGADPFQLTVRWNTWSDDLVEIAGSTSGFLFSAPALTLSQNSTFSELSYTSLGDRAPSKLSLLDLAGSPGWADLGAGVWSLDAIVNDLPVLTPSPAGDVQVSSLTPDAVNLEWAAAYGPVSNYSLLLGASPGALSQQIALGNVTSTTVSGLVPVEPYYFAVVAWNGSRPSAPTPTVGVETPNWSPGVPPGLAVAGTTPQSVELTWSPASGDVTSYSLLVATSVAGPNATLSVGNATTFNLTGLTPGTEYYVAVEAWNGSWTSGPSAAVPAVTPTLPAGAPGPSGLAKYSTQDLLTTLALSLGVVVGVVAPIAVASAMRTRSRRFG